MHSEISKQSRHEVLEALHDRYEKSSRSEKAKILDEFVAITHCHRKHAIRLLTRVEPVVQEALRPARRIYSEAVREALVVLWEAADRICGKRLKAILPQLVTAMERHGHLALDPTVRHRVLAVSPATIDRLLATVRGQASQRKKRRTSNKPSKQIPIRTFADWNEPLPGFLEVDFVSHGGSSMKGAFLWSLVATDVCSGWTEAVALAAREQTLVTEGLNVIRRQFPVPILGIDTDNDSAFINETLLAYCQEQKLEFTRSRAYQKNDQAWIEQKNGAVIRRFVGYERFAGMAAGQCLAQLLQGMRLFVNHFQPSFKLKSKMRGGQGEKALPQAGHALRATFGSSFGLVQRQAGASGGTRHAESAGDATSNPRRPSRTGCAQLRGFGSWCRTRKPRSVSCQASRFVACGRGTSHPSECVAGAA